MKWFRLYGEFATDAKVQTMSEIMQRRLIMIFCLQSIGDLEKLSDEEIAFALRISNEDILDTKRLFIEKRFIDDGWNLRKWNERQYVSDNSNERVKKYRERIKQNGSSSTGYLKHKKDIFKRDEYACVYCGSLDNLCIDHVVPVLLGGDDHIDNLVTACKGCNSGKSGRTPEQALMEFISNKSKLQYKRNLSRLRSRPDTVTVTAPDTDTESDKDTETKPETDIDKKTKQKFADSVLMTDEEYQKLVSDYGEQRTKEMITILDNYKGSSGKKYKSDYKAILSWVVGEWEKRKGTTGKPLTFQEKCYMFGQEET